MAKPQPSLGPRPPRAAHHKRTALALQGGGALGAYQCGVYQALYETGCEPDWISGVSIGAINAAIIAGNSRERRLERLRQFWETVSAQPGWLEPIVPFELRDLFNEISSALTVLGGRPGFFEPRLPPPWLLPPKLAKVTSYYDTAPLRATLGELVDFDRLNDGEMRYSISAVDVELGNYKYFDTRPKGRKSAERIGPEHVMASGALPPSLPPVEIGGRWYWDGGIVSNTPLMRILEDETSDGTLAFQVDLFSARGPVPANLADAMERHKDIGYSSRTRLMTEMGKRLLDLRCSVTEVLAMLPAESRDHHAVKRLSAFAADRVFDIVHLIYRSKYDESQSKDYEFSVTSMRERWQTGYEDAREALKNPAWLKPPRPGEAVRVFDPLRPMGG